MTPVKGTRREQAKAETRRLILEAAYQLFEKNGYDKTTMRQLAKEAGVGLGTIFQHFPDKAAVLMTAFQEDISSLAYEAIATMPETGLRPQLIHTMGPLFAFYSKRPNLSRTLIREGLFAGPKATKQLMDIEMEFTRFTTMLCERAKDNGELKRDTDSALIAETVWAFYVHVLIKGLRTGQMTEEALMENILALFDHFMAGLGPD